MRSNNFKEKTIKYRNYNIMTYISGGGDESAPTLLLLHGGPGFSSDYLRTEEFNTYVQKGFRVVTYDQLGCGASDHPWDNTELWNIPRFVEEMHHVCQTLNLGSIHILGHSWGTMLGLEYYLAHPQQVKSFIISNGLFNMAIAQRGYDRLKMALGIETWKMMALHEAKGSTDHVEYQAAVTLLQYRHVCNLSVWPECFTATMSKVAQPIFHKMVGRGFFNVDGSLENYDRTDVLSKVLIPCLILHGEQDCLVAECALHAQNHLPNAELVMLRNCSHYACIEDPVQYHKVVWDFLSKQLN